MNDTNRNSRDDKSSKQDAKKSRRAESAGSNTRSSNKASQRNQPRAKTTHFSEQDRSSLSGKTTFGSRSTKPSAGTGSASDTGRSIQRQPYNSDTARPTKGDAQKREQYQRSDKEDAGRPARNKAKSTYQPKAGRKDTKSLDNRPFRQRETFPSKAKADRGERVSPVLRSRKPSTEKDDGLIRLNRYIANAGVCSRRKADELIEAGLIMVNKVVVSELGHKIDPYKDEIRYNGELLKREKKVYVLLNKPKDYITTTDDPQERKTVMHLVDKASRERIYPIGRLDRNTTGLLLMTNDGELADKLSHPKHGITKIYHVELNKNLVQGDFNKIQFGLELEDGLIKPDNLSYVAGASKKEVGIQIHSGKNRIVRRIFEHLGYEVVKLDRVVYGNLTKKDLARGRWRYLTDQELIQMKHLIK